jgi:hypothetical protein
MKRPMRDRPHAFLQPAVKLKAVQARQFERMPAGLPCELVAGGVVIGQGKPTTARSPAHSSTRRNPSHTTRPHSPWDLSPVWSGTITIRLVCAGLAQETSLPSVATTRLSVGLVTAFRRLGLHIEAFDVTHAYSEEVSDARFRAGREMRRACPWLKGGRGATPPGHRHGTASIRAHGR